MKSDEACMERSEPYGLSKKDTDPGTQKACAKERGWFVKSLTVPSEKHDHDFYTRKKKRERSEFVLV